MFLQIYKDSCKIYKFFLRNSKMRTTFATKIVAGGARVD